MALEQTMFVGDDPEILVDVIENGQHVAASIDTTTTRVDGFSTAPQVTPLGTGNYRVSFPSLSPAPAEGDVLFVKVNGSVTGSSTTWTEAIYKLKVVPVVEAKIDTVDTEVGQIKAQTDQLSFSGGNVNANAVTGGTDPASIYTYFTASSRQDTFKADVSALATAASIAALNDFDPSSDTVANVTTVSAVTNAVTTDTASRDASKADVSGLATQSSVDTVDTEVGLIKSQTDQLRFTVSNQVDANALTGGSDATAANQTDIVNHLTDIKGAGWAAADNLAELSEVTNKLDSTLVADGLVWQFTVNALENAPSAGGGGLGMEDSVPSPGTAGTVGKALRQVLTNLDAQISTVGGSVGPGAIAATIEVTVAGQPEDNVAVWISTDEAGVNVIAGTLYTKANGQVTFQLDAGTYYSWKEKAGLNFVNPEEFTVS